MAVDIFALLYKCAVEIRYFQELAYIMFKKNLLITHVIVVFAVKIASHLQNTKPVQSCTGFIITNSMGRMTFTIVALHMFIFYFLRFRID